MKIALTCGYPLSETARYGVARHLRSLVNALSVVPGLELHVITLGDNGGARQRDGFTLHVVNKRHWPRPLSLIAHTSQLKKKLVEVAPDVVHAYGTYPTYSWPALGVRSRFPVVLTVCGLIAEEIKFQKGARYLANKFVAGPMEKRTLSRASHVVVQSPHVRDLVGRLNDGRSKIHVVPEGVDSPKNQGSEAGDQTADIFLAVSLTRLKGLDVLIRALPKVIESIPSLEVHIAGRGAEEENLKRMAKDLGVESRVKFLGYISDEQEIMRNYGACKVVVVPSRWDIEPFAPLHAAISGKPAIVSDKCNASVIIDGKTGFVFQSERVEELSAKIVRLLTDDRMRTDMGEAAREKAREYEWATIAKRTVEVYRQVMADFRERRHSSVS